MTRFTMTLTIASLMVCGTALGDLSGLNAWTDLDSFTWHGVATMATQDPDPPNEYMSADVEWVVEWVASAGKFKYTYQINATGGIGVTLLGVPMLSSNEAEDIGAYLLEAGNVAPSAYDFQPPPPDEPTLAAWSFEGLTAGQTSYALTYWSVNAPLMLGGYIADGGLFVASANIPSPSDVIPEPATLGVLVAGALAAVIRRRR